MAIRASVSPVGQLVAGELLADEAVVGLVVVERADDVVAVAPGVGLGVVALVAVGLGEPDEVEPVPAPLLAVAGRVEQAVDQLLVGVGRRVVDEGVDLLGRRRQAGQVVGRRGGSARASRRAGSGCSPFASSPARMKASIGFATQAAVLDRRGRRAASTGRKAQWSRSLSVIW